MSGAETKNREFDIIIVGGLGHIGLPLGIAFANEGQKVCLLDRDGEKAKIVNRGELPYVEYGAEEPLKRLIHKNLFVSLDPSDIAQSKTVIFTIGTPVDEYLNPKLRSFIDLIDGLKKFLHSDQLLVIRSTVFPRTIEKMAQQLGKSKAKWQIAYCPERIVQGHAMTELKELPQIVSGTTPEAVERASKLFSLLSPKIIPTGIAEAELVKLFSNAWRYLQFAAANQFYMYSTGLGVDYNKVRDAMIEGYGRNASLPKAGFSAGPCLLKDTLQLSALGNNHSILGHAAMMINEGLPNFIVEELRKKYVISCSKVGILGMAFKADVDDIRDSLSFKLGKILRFHGAKVFYSDEFAKDPTFVTKEALVKECNIVIVGAPHSAYKSLRIPQSVHVVDLWEVLPRSLPTAPSRSLSPEIPKGLH